MEGRNVSFGYLDHSFFFIMLGTSTMIGFYFGCYKKQNTISEFMFGGKRMSIFPISMSILATFISTLTLIGMPGEVYVYGTQIYAIVFGHATAIAILQIFYLPVICGLKFTSYFEYLEKRFNPTVRAIGSLVYISSVILVLPITIYGAALSYEQVSGINRFKLAPILCAVCILYTSVGGLKAVAWADTIQNFFTITGALTVLFLGLSQLGGIANVIESSKRGERLELLNFDLNPFRRNTFPVVYIGSMIKALTSWGAYPSSYQRFVSVPSYRHACMVANVTTIGYFIINSVVCGIGLMIYTKYHGCDPLITKEVRKADQLMVYFTMDVTRNYPGLAGLFISGVISASLSSMSTYLNTASLTIYEDFLKISFKLNISEKKSNLIMQAITILIGAVGTTLIIAVDKLGNIIQVINTLLGVTYGVSLYLFSLGMFIPFANSKGAIFGAVTALLTTGWIVAGSQLAIIQKKLRFTGKITSVADCPVNSTLHLHLNSTEFGYPGYGTVVEADEDVLWPYRLSYNYMYVIGFVVAMTVGVITSLLTGRQDMSKVDADLIVPQLRFLLPKKKVEEYSMVPQEESNQNNI